MNKILLILLAVLFSINVNAQTKNVNPNKNAEPWILGGLRVPSAEEINKIPEKTINSIRNSKELPTSLDNSTKPYFRPIFNQTDGCCAQASGIAYNFTYEFNREKGTAANTTDNQFPTHYTYNFLNGGSGQNGSWFWDGWEIIKANGCPTVTTYGGLAQDATYWMSGYDNYLSGKENRVAEIFSIDVSTPEGLTTLKHWMYDHLEGDSDGGIVNFAAGISAGEYNITYDNIITKWNTSVNHAMTFVGWDDNIEYDFNNDGNITNDIDINGDGVVNMQDWEKGAVIMVNSWGPDWGNGGKAYVMYKLLADPIADGGIFSNKVYSILVKDTYTQQLTMKVKMSHNSRNMIKVYAGVSANASSTEPEHVIEFPLFNKQGGEYDMRGTSTSPIELTLDITPLLSYINSNENANFFLLVDENDELSSASGQIYDFSIVDDNDNETVCTSHNVSVNDNDVTTLSITKAVTFEYPTITTSELPEATSDNTPYSHQLNATGGSAPYKWSIILDYTESTQNNSYPSATTELTPNDYDDGFASKELDFNFPFYGQNYSHVYLSTDGSIIFEPDFSYIRSEDAIKGAKVIAVCASDLMIYPSDGDGIFYEGNENYATFRWKTSLYDQQYRDIEAAVTIYPSGEIKFFYGSNTESGITWASGISNGDNKNFVIASNSGDYNPSNDKLRFYSDPFPQGMSISESGLFQGTPTETNTWNIMFAVTDYDNITKTKELTFTSAISNINRISNESANCYPNPVKNTATISYNSSKIGNVLFELYNISGKKIKSFTRQSSVGKNQIHINISKSKLSKGMYFYKITSAENNFTGKFIYSK